MKIVHVITGLGRGGAETSLARLVLGLRPERFDSAVVSLLPGEGAARSRLEGAGIPVRSLGMRSRVPRPGDVLRLAAVVRELAPEVIQGWMYHGNLAAWAAVRLLPGKPALAWNVRQCLYDIADEPPLTRLVIRLGARASARPDRIVYNTAVSASQHEALGFRGDRAVVIVNGFDLDRFRPDSEARERLLRSSLHLPEDRILIGMLARFHPVKDHATFIAAATRLARSRPDVHFVLAGPGIDEEPRLGRWIHEAGLSARTTLLGEQTNAAAFLGALDVHTSSSRAEGFPNVVAESMACGIVNVVTDVGSSADVVGETGRVVSPGDPTGLARAWLELCDLGPHGRQRLGRAARQRIAERYPLERCIERYEELYKEIAARCAASPVS